MKMIAPKRREVVQVRLVVGREQEGLQLIFADLAIACLHFIDGLED